MSSSRQLHLGAFMRPVSIHTAAWRYPGAFPDANFNFQHLRRFAQTLERGKFDAFFMADHLAVLNMPIQALKRSATVTSFDPLTLLPALAVKPPVARSESIHLMQFRGDPPSRRIAMLWRKSSALAPFLKKLSHVFRELPRGLLDAHVSAEDGRSPLRALGR